MCFQGGGGGSGGADESRRLENERNARISEGMGAIDQNYAGFDDGYYNLFEKKAYDIARPDLVRQYGDATDQATYGLARAGLSRSSAAAKHYGDLKERFGQADLKARDDARQLASERRQQVEQSRNTMVAQLNATANPQATAQASIAQAKSLTTPPAYSPITNAFADFSNLFADAATNRRAQIPGWWQQILPRGGSGSGSSGSSVTEIN